MTEENKITPQVSVVIPMYNCEEFVHGVLRMFSDQTFDDFEVICVIDGATDGTEEEVKKYCETDHRFRYVVRENGGAGAARNTGLDEAKGKYIVFPDADDVFEKDYLLRLYEAAEKNDAQMAICGAVTYDHLAEEQRKLSGFNKSVMYEGKVYSSKNTKHIFKLVDTSNQNKIFLLDFIKTACIRYSETPATNDLFFSKATLASADRIVVIHDDLVTIRRFINPQSISSHRGVHSHIALTELNKLYNWLNERGILGIHISEYLWLFDITLNYEMKNGVNIFLAEETVRTLNCDDPWINMNSGQIMQILKNSFDKKSGELIKAIPDGISSDKAEKIKTYNNIIKKRNESRTDMQELIKKTSIDRYKRDFDDPNSKSPFHDAGGITIQSSKNLKESDNPQITVVIPMYNCSEYVSEVLSMFADQSFHNFEVICVIDGATDNTEELVKKFCDKDSRFSYAVRENGGPGAARNTGLDMARGKYIIFSDADDEYSPEYLKKLYETAVKHDAQIVVSRFVERDHSIDADIIRGFNKENLYENIVYSHKGIDNLFMAFSSRVANKLFDLDFVRTNGLAFPNLRVSEDAYFSYATLSIAERIVVINDTLHTYRLHINQNSLSTNRFRFRHESVDSVRLLYQWLKNNSLLDYHKEDFMKRADNVLAYEGGSGATPRFISEFAHMLNEEEPFDIMTPEEILTYMDEGIFAKKAAQKEKELKRNVDLKTIEADKELIFLLNYYRNRIHTADLIREVSKERYGRDFERKDNQLQSKMNKYNMQKNENEEVRIKYHDWLYPKNLPKTIRIDATTHCQLCCAECGIQKNNAFGLGKGFLKFENFKRFLDENPQIERVELSNNGEIFLNPDLIKIMEYSFQKGVALEADMGTNFNTVSDEQLQALVDYEFRFISFSIDGASQETYSQYRRGGVYEKVIANVKKLIEIKTKCGSRYPEMRWQFVPNEFNEGEIEQAKDLAKELGIPIWFKLNYLDNYKPSDPEQLKAQTGLSEVTREEYLKKHKLPYLNEDCLQVFLDPQFNWDGMFLGCCRSWQHVFKPNIFDDGLEACINSDDLRKLKEFLLLHDPDPEIYKDLPCWNCILWKGRQKFGKVLELPSSNPF